MKRIITLALLCLCAMAGCVRCVNKELGECGVWKSADSQARHKIPLCYRMEQLKVLPQEHQSLSLIPSAAIPLPCCGGKYCMECGSKL